MTSRALRFARTCSTVRSKLAQPFEREELALQRHQNRVGGGQRIDGDERQRRRAIEQDIGEIVAQFAECRLQLVCPVLVVGDLQFDTEQIHGGGRQPQVRDSGRLDRSHQGTVAVRTS